MPPGYEKLCAYREPEVRYIIFVTRWLFSSSPPAMPAGKRPRRRPRHRLPVARLARAIHIPFAHVVPLLRQYFAMIGVAIKGDGRAEKNRVQEGGQGPEKNQFALSKRWERARLAGPGQRSLGAP